MKYLRPEEGARQMMGLTLNPWFPFQVRLVSPCLIKLLWHYEVLMIRLPLFLRRAAMMAILWSFIPSVPAQIVVEGGDEVDFRSIGINTNGFVSVAGYFQGDPTIFCVTGTGIELTRLPLPPSTEHVEDLHISRDGRHVVGGSYNFDIDRDRILLWNVAELGQPVSIESNDEDFSPKDVTSTAQGALVLGDNGGEPFTWSEANGFKYWPVSYEPLRFYQFDGMSQDGTTFVGTEYFMEGTNVQYVPVVAVNESISHLDSRRSARSLGFAISPNGSWMTGHIDLVPVIWEKSKVRRLSLGTNSVFLLSITDSGWAGGRSNNGSVVYDGKGRKLQRFDNWWANEFPEMPLPTADSMIQDLHEDRGTLYFLMRYLDPVTEWYRGFIAIVPLSALKQAK